MRRGRARLGWLAAVVIAPSVGAIAAQAPPALAAATISINSPASGANVDGTRFQVRGAFSASSTDGVNVIYVVDVSGSTAGPTDQDCNGDGKKDTFDDFNSAGAAGDTLDCEISGIISLNASLRDRTNVQVALVPFGSSATTANLNATSGGREQAFIRPVDDANGNRTADLVEAAGSMTQGQIGVFSSRSVGTGTDFDAAVSEMLKVKGQGSFNRTVAFFLSDGESSVTPATLSSLSSSGAEVRTYAIGTGTGCQVDGPLDKISKATGQACTKVTNPASLQGVLGGTQPTDLDRIEVDVNGTVKKANVDVLGNWDAEFTNVATGSRTIKATAFLKNGTTATDSITINVKAAGRTYVALGDSYSAGEGIEKFLSADPFDATCRRSEKAYARQIKFPNAAGPIATDPTDGPLMRFVACSGALLKHFDTVPQKSEPQDIDLQVTALGPDTDLVTLTFGGNDAGFSSILIHCAAHKDCKNSEYQTLSSGKKLTLGEWAEVRIRLIQNELVDLYRRIRTETRPNTKIVVATYPRFFKQGYKLRLGCKEAVVFTSPERDFLSDAVVEFAQRIVASANQAGVGSVDVVDAFRGHEICSGGVNAKDEWTVGHETAWKPDAGGFGKVVGQGSFHPNEKGAAAYAKEINDFLVSSPVAAAAVAAEAVTPVQRSAQASPAALTAAQIAPQLSAAATLADSLTDQEKAEVRGLEVEEPGLSSISAIKDPATPCPATAVPGQQLALVGSGFKPGSSVQLSFKASNEDSSRSFKPLTANAQGSVSGWVLVPTDASANLSEPETAEVGVATAGAKFQLDGTSATGNPRRLAQWFFLDASDSECGKFARDTGQISNGRDLAPASGGSGFAGTLFTSAQTGNRGGNGLAAGAVDTDKNGQVDSAFYLTVQASDGGKPTQVRLNTSGSKVQFSGVSATLAAFHVDGVKRSLIVTGEGTLGPAGGARRLFEATVSVDGPSVFGLGLGATVDMCIYEAGQSCKDGGQGVVHFTSRLTGFASLTPAAR